MIRNKKENKMKKIKLGLKMSSILMIIAPVITTISCTNNNDDPKSLTLSMRAEDVNPFKNAIDKFKEKTGIKVKIILVNDQKANYSTWDGTNSLPDIALTDQNTAKDAIKEKKWFQSINLNEIKNAKYDVLNDVPKEFDFEDEANYEGSKVFASFYSKQEKNSENNHNVIGIPYGYGSQGIYFNKLNLNFNLPLNAYVPKQNGSFVKIKISDNPTMETIKTFLANSGTRNDKKTNNVSKSDHEINTEISRIDKTLVWYDNGPYAMYQRLGSIGKSLGKNNVVGWIKDIGFPFELIASLGGGIFNGTLLDDEKLQTLFPAKNGGKSNNATFLKLYQSYFGYFNKEMGTKVGSYAANPKLLNTPGEADAFWAGKGNIMLGYKWQAEMIKSNWYKKNSNIIAEKYDNAVEVLPSPYGSIGVDALSLSKDLSGKKLENAKKFLRFIFEQGKTNNAYNITLQKTISPIIVAKNKQKNNIDIDASISDKEKSRQNAFFDSSKGETYNNIRGGIMASSTNGIYDIYNGQFGGDSGLKSVLLGNSVPTNFVEWKQKFDSILGNVENEIAIKNVGL